MCNKARALTSVLVFAAATGVSAQSWPAPPAQVFASANGADGFRTQPSGSGDARGMSQGWLFRPAPDGTGAVVWTGVLLNVPHRAIVTDDGKHVVTFDVWARLGSQRCLVIYDEHGIVVTSFDLEDLLSKEEIARVPVQANGSRDWLMGAKVEFNERGDRVVLSLSWGRVISIALATGKVDAA